VNQNGVHCLAFGREMVHDCLAVFDDVLAAQHVAYTVVLGMQNFYS